VKVLGPTRSRSRMFSAALLTCFLPLILFLAGCGTTVVGAGAAAPTVALAATPGSVASGTSSVLNVSAHNASAVVITGSDGSRYSMPGTGGSQTVTPSATTTYTATATGGAGTTPATASATVTVNAPAATTVTLSAKPSTVAAGASSTLTVVAANATSVTLSGSDGSSYSLSVTGGTQTVTPAATTTYTASAVGVTGSAPVTAQAVVTVTSAVTKPTVTISANPQTVTSGSSSTLSVTATNATSVVVTGSDGSKYALTPTGGTQTVTPTATTTYTASAIGVAGSAPVTSQTVVTVTSAATPTVSIGANPQSIASGNSSTLTVTATNATSVVVTGSDGSKYALTPTGGTQTVTPTATTTYTASAVGAAGSAPVTAQAVVTVTSAATPTVSISANPQTVTSGSSSTLTVTATNATSVVVTGSDGSKYTLTSTGGTQTVTPAASTTYTATATGTGGTVTNAVTVTVTPPQNPTVTLTSSQPQITAGNSDVLTVTATNATGVTLTGSDNTTYTASNTGGNQTVSPTTTTTYTATATGATGTTRVSATVTITVVPAGTVQSINHVIFMLQENHSFDSYFGMLNPYRVNHGFDKGADGKTYAVDGLVEGINDKRTTISNQNDEGTNYSLFKLKSTCVDDMTSSWLESYGDISRYDFSTTRGIKMDGFVHTAENFAKTCLVSGSGCTGAFTDVAGQRAMGYYDETFLNYYYYMASQFAVSDRWFSPISSKSIPNRIVTFSGGTSQGLAFDPGVDDHLPQLGIATIFSELDQAKVSWKIYYTTTEGGCIAGSSCAASSYPDTILSYFSFANRYLNKPANGAACVAPTVGSSAVGDPTNSFCIDPAHIVPLPQYYTDVQNKTLPSFSFIEAGAGHDDEHPGSGQSVLAGQNDVAKVVNGLMSSPSWSDSAFFLSYDEGGGPYDHVPPVPNHSNQNTDATVGSASLVNNDFPDISRIAVNADGYGPCLAPGGVPTQHCDISVNDPGGHSTDAAAQQGFAAQLGFRVPNLIISPFTRKHYVGHAPMDHTAVLKFVENRFIGPSAHLTARDAAQPNLLDFFDFSSAPWATPPAPPAPVTPASLGYDPCTPQTFAP
jgi:phospholipase C